MCMIKFSIINTKEEYDNLLVSARTFPDGRHDRVNFGLPVVTMHNDNGLCGYFTQIRHPINIPAWHPELVSHREQLAPQVWLVLKARKAQLDRSRLDQWSC